MYAYKTGCSIRQAVGAFVEAHRLAAVDSALVCLQGIGPSLCHGARCELRVLDQALPYSAPTSIICEEGLLGHTGRLPLQRALRGTWPALFINCIQF